MKYDLRQLDPSPKMTDRVAAVVDGTYLEAVAAAHELYRQDGRRVSVTSAGEIYAWHTVSASGVATDRNTNSGVPARQELAPSIDVLVRKHSAFKSLEDLTTAAGGYFPSIRCKSLEPLRERAELLRLADAYDAAQAARNDPRRAYRS